MVGFRAVVMTLLKGAEVQVNEELVFLGAGRVEVALWAFPPGRRCAPSIESSQLNGLEQQTQIVTAS